MVSSSSLKGGKPPYPLGLSPDWVYHIHGVVFTSAGGQRRVEGRPGDYGY